MNNSKKKLTSFLMATTLVVGTLTGCAQKTNSKINVVHEFNAVKNYDTATIERGNASINYTFYLMMEGYNKKTYTVGGYNNVLDKVCVSEGDYVHEGDTLIRFKSDDVADNLEECLAKIEENKLLIEHYKNLMKADKNIDYEDEIEILQDDNDLNELYVKQYQTQISFNDIKAAMDSYVIYIDPYIRYGVQPGMTLVTTVAGSDIFVSTYEESYEFNVGEKYKATTSDKKVIYDVTVEKVELREDGKHQVTFRSKDKKIMIKGGGRLRLDITDENAELNSCYVDSAFVYANEGNYYVYIIDDNGKLSIRDIEIERMINNYTVIKSGVNEGERVARF